MPTVVQSALRFLVIFGLSIFWTLVTTARMVLLWWRNRSTFFSVKKHPRPAVLESPEWRHRTVRLSKIQMHIVECVSGNANANEDEAVEEEKERRPLMLFLHGFPEFWYSWRFQLRHFRDKFQAVAVDLRGYNDSDKPRGVANYDLEVLVADIVELIQILTRKKRPVVLVGHDWGAAICWALAIERPELIDRLVIMNVPHPNVATKLIRTKSSQLLKSWYMFFFQSPWLPELSMWSCDFAFFEQAFLGQTGLVHKENFKQEDLEAWKYAFSKPNALSPPINYYRALFRSPDRASPFEPVRPKTLIIWGERDAFLETEMADMSGGMCREAKVEKIADASHWVQQDVPERVNKVMEEWLHDLRTAAE